MKAVIVAAGRSSRLYPRTLECPKPLLLVTEDNQTLLHRTVQNLKENGIEEIVVVVGYKHEQIRETLGEDITYVLNPFFAQTNNMASLWLALPYIGSSDFIYLHGDLVYHPALLHRLFSEATGCSIDLLVDFGPVDKEAMKVRIDDGRFKESSKDIPLTDAAGEWTGIARIDAAAGVFFREQCEQLLADGMFQSYDTAVFNRMACLDVSFGMISTSGMPWKEIDTEADLQNARNLFRG